MKKSNFSKLRNLLCVAVFCLTTSGLFAQANFSGTWAFNESKSNFGGSQFRFAATTMIVTQTGNDLSVESTMPGRDGGKVLIIESTRPGSDGEMKTTVAYDKK